MSNLQAQISKILQMLCDGDLAITIRVRRRKAPTARRGSALGAHQDVVARFVEQCCHRAPMAETNSTELYKAFCVWQGDERPPSHRAFSTAMANMGIKKVRKRNGIFFLGIRLTPFLTGIRSAQ